MNRAILVIICDFLVLAMLSFSTGGASDQSPYGVNGAVVDRHTAAMIVRELRNEQSRLEEVRKHLREAQYRLGFTSEREQSLRETARALAEARARSESLEKRLKGQKLVEANVKELEQRLASENVRNKEMQIRLEDQTEKADVAQRKWTETAGELSKSQQQVAMTQGALSQAREGLNRTREELSGAQRKLEDTGRALGAAHERVSAKERELQRVSEEQDRLSGHLREARQRSGDALKKVEKYELEVSFVRGKLSATERALAESRSSLDRTGRLVRTRELELAESRKQVENMRGVLKKSVTELSEVGRDAIQSKTAAARSKAEADSLRKQLAELEARLRSDVLERYSSSTMKLSGTMREKRLWGEYVGDSVLYLPPVKSGNAVYFITDFRKLAGVAPGRDEFSQVSDFGYRIGPAEGEAANAKSVLDAGIFYSMKKDARVGLLESKSPCKNALPLLTLPQLKKRGVEQLHLFKPRSFGRDSCELGGRASIDFAAEEPYLMIRNPLRGSSSELAAEPGDFVLTRQGEFVGVVVSGGDRKRDALCYVFAQPFKPSDGIAMMQDKASEYAEFMRIGNDVLKNISALDRR